MFFFLNPPSHCYFRIFTYWQKIQKGFKIWYNRILNVNCKKFHASLLSRCYCTTSNVIEKITDIRGLNSYSVTFFKDLTVHFLFLYYFLLLVVLRRCTIRLHMQYTPSYTNYYFKIVINLMHLTQTLSCRLWKKKTFHDWNRFLCHH